MGREFLTAPAAARFSKLVCTGDAKIRPAMIGFTLFDTAIGSCALAWGPGGVVGVQLPEENATKTRARVRERFPDARETAPPQSVRRARDAIVALLNGEARNLSQIALDMAGLPPFHRRVYEFARSIAPGETLAYGEIAERLGAHGAARAVGQAMRRNPFAIIVPCHRVLASGGKVGGFSSTGGVTTKLKMLAIEGAWPKAIRADHRRKRARRPPNGLAALRKRSRT